MSGNYQLMTQFYEFVIFALFVILVIIYGSRCYWFGQALQLQEQIECLTGEIKWLHLTSNEDRSNYEEFYKG